MKNSFTYYGELPSLNDYTARNRQHRMAGAEMKKRAENGLRIAVRAFKLEKVDKPCVILLDWYEKNNRRDADNVVFAKKFILDALVKEGILPDDNRKWVKGFVEHVYTDPKNPRIEVEIKEM